jgi:hypothetical protein
MRSEILTTVTAASATVRTASILRLRPLKYLAKIESSKHVRILVFL